MATVFVRGCGDVGSAVAHVLFNGGHAVLLHDVPRPSHARRGMAFTDAFFEGRAELDGLIAKRLRALESLPPMMRCHRAVPVTAEPVERILPILQPEVIVDARMRKRVTPESQRGMAPLTIGLGPNFVAGSNVDLAVETAWGESLGDVLHHGSAKALEGEPREIAGIGRERFAYAPVTGEFRTTRMIGDAVDRGDWIGTVGGSDIHAPIAGHIRGLTHSGALVDAGTKVLDLDPRENVVSWFGLGERPRRIAEAVLVAIESAARIG